MRHKTVCGAMPFPTQFSGTSAERVPVEGRFAALAIRFCPDATAREKERLARKLGLIYIQRQTPGRFIAFLVESEKFDETIAAALRANIVILAVPAID